MRSLKKAALFLILLFYQIALSAQCPEITETSATPDCNPECELCEGEVLTIRLKGFDLPNGGKIDYFFSDVPGFNPYNNQGVRMGSANIITPGGNCRICPELLGFIIDACGTEAQNEFIVIWTGSGFNTSNFVFDYDANNNFGAGNGDLGSSCGIAPGPAGLVGCMATSVGGGFNLPGNAIWIVFTSSGPNFAYDFSAVCGLGLKVFVSMSSCNRSSGAFSNNTSTGLRTQTMSINGCACAASVTYDTDDPALTGNGDAWAGGLTNGGCAASITGPGSYTPATSIIDPFSFTIPQSWCGKKYEIVGIVNPKPDPMCCMEEFTERLQVSVNCPKAKPATLEVCDNGNGLGIFNLEDAEPEILGPGGSGTVEWFKNQNGTNPISSPYTGPSGVIYARVKEGRCNSPMVQVILKANPLPVAKPAGAQLCEEKLGLALFKLIDLQGTITNNNPNLKLRFYEDPDLLNEIIPPYLTASTVIYATVANDKCASLPVEITLTVIPSPNANSVGDTLCDSGDGTALFILSRLDSLITGGTRSDSVRYFEDSLGKTPISSPLRSSGQTVWAIVYKAPCKSMPAAISLYVSHPPTISQLIEQACDEGNGTGIFDLKNIILKLQNGNPGISIAFYRDSTLNVSVNPPILVNVSDTIYAVAQLKDCISQPVKIILQVINRPVAYPAEISICSNLPNDQAEFDLEEIKIKVLKGQNLETVFYTDSSLNTVIQGKLITSADTLYAITKEGSCNSLPVMVFLKAIARPQFSHYPDTSACEGFILGTLIGRSISQNASYYIDSMNTPIRKSAGDTITESTLVYLFDTVGPCLTKDSFQVEIYNSLKAGDDFQSTICSGTILNLENLIQNGSSGGRFVDPSGKNLLNGPTFNSSGLAGNQFLFLYIVNAPFPCTSDTAILNIHVDSMITAGADQRARTCPQTVPISLESLFGVNGSSGIFSDPASTGALNGTVWNSQISGKGNFPVLFITGDGSNCPKDTAILFLEIPDVPDFINLSDLRGCEFVVLPELSREKPGPSSGYFSQPGGRGLKYQPGDTIRSTIKLYALVADADDFCQREDSLNIEVGRNYTINVQKDNLCPDEFILIGNERYDYSRPSGTEVLKASVPGDCDTLLQISLSFRPEAKFGLKKTLCQGDYLIVNNKRYDQSNPSGLETLMGAASTGCDSIIQVDLDFAPNKTATFFAELCKGDSMFINGKVYHEFRTSGSDTLFGATAEGCDSIVEVSLQLIRPGILDIDSILCPGEYLSIRGIRLDSLNPQYFSILKGAASNGCDSITDIKISYHPESRAVFNYSLCENQSIVINGRTYDLQNPEGYETFQGGSFTGCDSVLHIRLDFVKAVVSNYKTRLCRGDSIRIGSKVYSEFRTSGSDTLARGSIAGCDSILLVEVTLNEPSYYLLEDTLCEGEYLTLDGIRFDESNPAGSLILENQNMTGCDSIIRIHLHFNQLKASYTSLFEIDRGTKIQMDLQPGFSVTSINWAPGEGLSCDDCLNPEASPIENTEYQATLRDENGCEIVVRIRVVVRTRNDVSLPNSFSPNSDGVNDRFRIESPSPDLRVITFIIYDRWGNKVYSESDKSAQDMAGWDGRYKGQDLMPGVYVYHLSYKTSDGRTAQQSGDLTLIR